MIATTLIPIFAHRFTWGLLPIRKIEIDQSSSLPKEVEVYMLTRLVRDGSEDIPNDFYQLLQYENIFEQLTTYLNSLKPARDKPPNHAITSRLIHKTSLKL